MLSTRTADADAARALTQAVLITWLCDRYHDLASLASESLKQRIHFLSKPDRSNIKELCTWDPLSSSSSSSAPSWSPVQIDTFVHESWSPDQLPLHPPKIRLSSSSTALMSNFSFDSWETTPVLVKELDQETIQAMVPIGQSTDGSILVMILSSELESENENSVKQIPRWKYHNMVAISESVLTSTESDWRPFLENDQYLVPSPTMFVNAITPAGQEDEEQEERASELSDSDDDYWGQYGDTEDEAAADEGLEGTTAKTQQPGNHLNEASTETPNGDEDDEDDEYWRKYAEQQEEQEAEEKKKKLKEHPQPSSSGFGGVPVSAGFDSVDLSTSSTQTRIMAEVEDPKLTCSKVGQVDPNMLSSLLQMLSSQGLHQVMSKSVQEEQIQKEQELQMPLYGQQTVSSQEPLHLTDPSTSAYSPTTTASSTSPSAVSVLETSLRSVVQQATLAGLSKDKVFEVLTEIYAASSLH